MNKKIIVLILSSILIVSLIGSSYAYFVKEATTSNVVTASNLQIELITQKQDGTITSDSLQIMPGDSIDESAKIKNIGKEDAWVRLSITVNDELMVDDNVVILEGLNNSDWTYSNGYYYYNNKLSSGQTSSSVFEGIVISDKVGNEFAGKQMNLKINGQAVQAKNNGNSSLQALGWSE